VNAAIVAKAVNGIAQAKARLSAILARTIKSHIVGPDAPASGVISRDITFLLGVLA
jgi:hypothetical protein